MKNRIEKVFIFLLITLISVGLIFSGQQNLNIKKRVVKPGFQLNDRYLSGIVYEDAATGRNVRRHMGIFDSNCRRIYIRIPDAAPQINVRPGFSEVRVKVSGAAYLKINQAASIRNAIWSKSVIVIKKRQFEGTVMEVNCNDGYFDMNYRMCDYGSFTVRVAVSSGECSRLNLMNGTRVRVTSNNWSYSPGERKFTLNSILSVRKF